MVERYYKFHNECLEFQVVKFVRDHKKHVHTLRSLRTELVGLDTIKGISYDSTKVQTSGVGDPTARLALVKDEIQNKIAEYEFMVDLYDKTMKELTDEERTILETMYNSNTLYPDEILMDRLYVGHTTLYRRRKQAINHFETLVTGFLP